jgi:nitroimidazol reductase NimA-like FMN-containing flavoprotein (pyridoxamine 5'-phosphate oxidase superfamily)
MTQDPQKGEVPPQVLEYLREHKTVTIATASLSGAPHAATMMYADEGLTLYFCTRPDSRTAQYLEGNPRVAFTIDEYYPDWTKTKGIQGTGDCRQLLDPEEVRHAVQLFRQKFDGLADSADDTSSLRQLCIFRIAPAGVAYINNPAGGAKTPALGMDYHKSLVYSVFRHLPEQQIDAITGQLETVEYESGATIVRQGAPADKFFIIVDGEVTVLRDSGQGEVPVATLGRGQFFGEIAILQDTPRTATARATSPVTLLTMDRSIFRSLVAQSLSTTQDFDRLIRERLTALGRQTGRP